MFFSCYPSAHTTLNILLSDRADLHDNFRKEIICGEDGSRRVLWISVKMVAGLLYSIQTSIGTSPMKAKGWIPPRALAQEAVVFGVHFYNESVTIAIPSINVTFTAPCSKGIMLQRRMSIHYDRIGDQPDWDCSRHIHAVPTNVHSGTPFWFSS